jgi:hypothetical protein
MPPSPSMRLSLRHATEPNRPTSAHQPVRYTSMLSYRRLQLFQTEDEVITTLRPDVPFPHGADQPPRSDCAIGDGSIAEEPLYGSLPVRDLAEGRLHCGGTAVCVDGVSTMLCDAGRFFRPRPGPAQGGPAPAHLCERRFQRRPRGADGVLNQNRERYVILSVGWPDGYLWGAALNEVRAVAAGPRAAGVAPPVDGAHPG